MLTSRGLTSTVDGALQARTFEMIQSSVRNQDLISFFRGFSLNTEALYALREFFEANYYSVGLPPLGLCAPIGLQLDDWLIDQQASRDDHLDETYRSGEGFCFSASTMHPFSHEQ